MDYLDKLKEKCNLSDEFMEIVISLFEKLENFGYINRKKTKELEKKLYDNVDVVILGNAKNVDYKTGYYDAVKKELYIKDETNVKAIYLRIIYIITTTEIADETYSIGYSTSKLSKSDYKIIHKNFAINRAVVSNLVCRLLYTLPTTLSIVPTYRTYENDFLGKKITSDNDIYFLEGKLFSQFCYSLNIAEEDFYINLFEKPNKFIEKCFAKHKFKDYEKFLNLFDNLSRKYSNYNKLMHLNKLLDDNYIEIKKNILNDVTSLETEQEKIKQTISKTLAQMFPKENENDDEIDINIEASLAENITNLEEEILSNITDIQNIFSTILVNSEDKYAEIEYAVHLKELSKLLVIPNNEIEEKLFDVISSKILKYDKNISSNLTEKIKYSIVNEILSNDKFVKIYKEMGVQKLNQINVGQNNALVAINVDSTFVKLVKVTQLNKKMINLKDNTISIRLDSMGYILNTPTATKDVSKVEKIFTKIRNQFNEFNTVRIENMFIGEIDEITLVVVEQENKFSILEISLDKDDVSCKLVNLSSNYSLFNTKSNLPVLYEKTNPIKKLLSMIFPFI